MPILPLLGPVHPPGARLHPPGDAPPGPILPLETCGESKALQSAPPLISPHEHIDKTRDSLGMAVPSTMLTETNPPSAGFGFLRQRNARALSPVSFGGPQEGLRRGFAGGVQSRCRWGCKGEGGGTHRSGMSSWYLIADDHAAKVGAKLCRMLKYHSAYLPRPPPRAPS
eukprot:1167323-Pyramimonas_sp.AAC.1